MDLYREGKVSRNDLLRLSGFPLAVEMPRNWHRIKISAEEYAQLRTGARTFWAVDDDGSVLVADMLVFQTGIEPGFLRQVTHLWTHDGIAPGWAIASLRPMRLTIAD